MLGRQRDGGVDRQQPVVDALLRQPHHQVEADVVESRGPRLGKRVPGPVGVVQSRQPAEFLVAERLDTVAQSIDAGFPKCREARLVDRFRVRLHRDLDVR